VKLSSHANRYGLLALAPALNLLAAMAATGIVVLAIYWLQFRAGAISLRDYWQLPARAAWLLISGAFGDIRSICYTLFYATDFIFAGLAVAVAAHAGLFNIGGEGQAYVAGFAVAATCLTFNSLPAWLLIPTALAAAMIAGALWAFAPGYLYAKRGCNVVITTIMFNFIASAAMSYLLVHVLMAPGRMSPESPRFALSAHLPDVVDLAHTLGLKIPRSPLNVSFLLALACSVAVWVLIWRTRWGYAIRALGFSPRAARYGGIAIERTTVAVMCLSGALAGLIAINEVMGAQHRLVLNYVAGAGMVGVAVSLMGRNHPAGIVVSSLLFGALYQGGFNLSFQLPEITRDMVVVIQGLIILFAGALDNLGRGWVNLLFARGGAVPER
jgi:ABC-type uncharacterized transport system permease subunit